MKTKKSFWLTFFAQTTLKSILDTLAKPRDLSIFGYFVHYRLEVSTIPLKDLPNHRVFQKFILLPCLYSNLIRIICLTPIYHLYQPLSSIIHFPIWVPISLIFNICSFQIFVKLFFLSNLYRPFFLSFNMWRHQNPRQSYPVLCSIFGPSPHVIFCRIQFSNFWWNLFLADFHRFICIENSSLVFRFFTHSLL